MVEKENIRVVIVVEKWKPTTIISAVDTHVIPVPKKFVSENS